MTTAATLDESEEAPKNLLQPTPLRLASGDADADPSLAMLFVQWLPTK